MLVSVIFFLGWVSVSLVSAAFSYSSGGVVAVCCPIQNSSVVSGDGLLEGLHRISRGKKNQVIPPGSAWSPGNGREATQIVCHRYLGTRLSGLTWRRGRVKICSFACFTGLFASLAILTGESFWSWGMESQNEWGGSLAENISHGR